MRNKPRRNSEYECRPVDGHWSGQASASTRGGAVVFSIILTRYSLVITSVIDNNM